MLDAITLDQLRTFVTVVDEGSFSAAGRKLRRVQSAVSHAMNNLEAHLGVRIWDRSTRVPALTDDGAVLLTAARKILSDVDALKRLAGSLVGGLEASVSIAVDAILPLPALVDLCREFADEFPTVQLRVFTETMSAVSALVIDGTCHIGVIGPAAKADGLEREHLAYVRMVPVAARTHPLASMRGRIPTEALSEHVHVVLSERGSAPTPDQGVLSPRNWRVADLWTKHAMIVGGLGWGNLPEHMIKDDLARGRLVRIRPAAWGDDDFLLSLAVVHRPDLAKGPATRWILERMRELCIRDAGPQPSRQRPRRPRRKAR